MDEGFQDMLPNVDSFLNLSSAYDQQLHWRKIFQQT